MPLFAKAILGWLLLLAAMFANGTLRVLVLQPQLGEHVARQVAVLTGIAIVVSLTFPFVRALARPTGKALMGVGVLWLILTVAFEFLFGHYVGRASWDALLEDYNLLEGRLWPFVLVAVAVAPWAWGRFLRR